MKNRLHRVVFSTGYILTGLILLVLLIMPENSPVGIPSGYKIIPATVFTLILFWVLVGGHSIPKDAGEGRRDEKR